MMIVAHQLPVETSEMFGVFSPNRSLLVTGGDGPAPKVQIWDFETGDCTRISEGSCHARERSGFGTRQRANACKCFKGTLTPFEPLPGVKIIGIFSQLPMTIPCGFGSPKLHVAFKQSKDTRSVLSALLGAKITELYYHATPAVESGVGRAISKHLRIRPESIS